MIKRPQLDDEEAVQLVDALTTAVIVARPDLTICRVNSAAESMLALGAGKLVGSSIVDIFSDPGDLVLLVERSIRDGRSFTERDLELVTVGMQSVLVDCTISSWTPHSSMQPKAVIELTSVERHQRIQLEESMLIQNQATSALMRGLAHEVKNPLGGIRGAAQLLQRELVGKGQAEYTEIIIGEADRLRTLVDRMLGPHRALERQAVNIHDVLERVRQLVAVEFGDAINLERDYDPSLPELSADRDQLIQAFLNLFRNAARAIGDSNGQITVRSRAQRNITIGDKVHRLVIRIDVIDNGPGVPREISDSLFYPMVSGHDDGTGLGLPLAQAMVNRQGGLIGFKSEPGHTAFTVWLPVEATV